MSKKVMQFRYYNDNNSKNYPVNPQINRINLNSGSIFSNFFPIAQLGIQAIPGTKFYLNNADTAVIIGSTGIYELDLNGLSEITSLSFDASSLALIASNPNAYLIIDIIYGGNE